MNNKSRCLSIYIFILCFFTVLMPNTVFAQSRQQRLYGNDRYQTAVNISQNGWPDVSDYIILARGDDFADALCAGPLAKKYNAPILLTDSNKLNENTQNEIKRLKVKYIIIVGGIGAISPSIEDTLKLNMKLDVQRISGDNRYETSIKIAQKLGTSDKIVLATGGDFPDALSISYIATKLGMPILLVEKDKLSEDVRQYIASRKISQSYIIGKTAVIGEEIERLVPNAKRIGGNDRFETNIAVMKEFEEQTDFNKIFIAVGEGPNGDEFADALSGAVLAANTSSPIVLVYKIMPEASESYIKAKSTKDSIVIALGGENAVGQAIVDTTLAAVINGMTKPSEILPAPAGGGTVPSVQEITIHDIKALTNDGANITANNGDNISFGGKLDNVVFNSIQIDADPNNCTVEIDHINANGLELLSTPIIKILNSIDGIMTTRELLGAFDSGMPGIELKNLRTAFRGGNISFVGYLKKDGYKNKSININIQLGTQN